jgi:hypothetical protein
MPSFPTNKPIYITSATNGGLYYIVLDGNSILGYNYQGNGTMTLEFQLPSKTKGGNRPADVSRAFLATPFNERHLSSRRSSRCIREIISNLSPKAIFLIGAGATTFIVIIIAMLARLKARAKSTGAAEIDNSTTSIVHSDRHTVLDDIEDLSEEFSALNLTSAPSVRPFALDGIRALSGSRPVSIPTRVSRRPQSYYTNNALVGSNSSVTSARSLGNMRDEDENDEEFSGIVNINTNVDQRSGNCCNIM